MNGWDYYRTLLKIGDQYYSADFVVRKDANRNVIYDLEKINEADISQMPLPGLEARGVTLKINQPLLLITYHLQSIIAMG